MILRKLEYVNKLLVSDFRIPLACTRCISVASLLLYIFLCIGPPSSRGGNSHTHKHTSKGDNSIRKDVQVREVKERSDQVLVLLGIICHILHNTYRSYFLSCTYKLHWRERTKRLTVQYIDFGSVQLLHL